MLFDRDRELCRSRSLSSDPESDSLRFTMDTVASSQPGGSEATAGADTVDDLLEWSKNLSFMDYCDNVLGESM